MQTAAISYRVADFLKKHPPFHCLDDPDLLALVSHGRVKFHERDEFLCWQSKSYTPFVLVIQQGVVSLWEELDGKELLRDIRGPGDMIGIERFLGSQSYPYSARANGDVVVYALQAADFEPLLARYPQANRYVDAYAAAGAVYRDASRAEVHEKFVAELVRHPEPLSCHPDSTVAEAARIMRTADSGAVAVMLEERLLGMVTARDVVGWVADERSGSQSIKDIMRAAPPPVAPYTFVSECVLAMSRADSSAVALTADGTSQGGLLRLLSAEDLQPAFGDNPLNLLHQIAHASGKEVLRVLHLRARAFLLAQLTGPSAVDWLTALGDRINRCVLKRLIELAGDANGAWNWCLWGAAGRGELLSPVEPGIALLCRDAADEDRGWRALDRLRADLSECGYLPRTPPECGDTPLCAAVAAWQERFARWVRDPVLSRMYAARGLFDLRPALGDADLWRHLERTTGEAIRGEPSFQKVLAIDCLSALPPLTFFENAVIEESGESTGTFALERRALGPIVEVGRAFGIANERIFGCPTSDRLDAARLRTPAHESIFRDAAETLRVLLYLQGRTGLRLQNSGDEILPSQLSRLDRQSLKSGFRAIHRLLEFTAGHLWAAAL